MALIMNMTPFIEVRLKWFTTVSFLASLILLLLCMLRDSLQCLGMKMQRCARMFVGHW